MHQTERIPVDELVVDPIQTRATAWDGDEQDRRLADSLASVGLLQALLVRPIKQVTGWQAVSNDADASYAIIAGSRRYHAAMDAGYEAVPCTVLEADDLEAAWTSLVENTDRKDLSEQEIAQQLKLIYEQVRPVEGPDACPDCGRAVESERSLHAHYGQTDCAPPPLPTRGATADDQGGEQSPIDPVTDRFSTDRQARRYLAQRFLGRTDDSAVEVVTGHLRTAELPDLVQTLFKDPADRTATERTALDNYGIDTRQTLGSGDGWSGTASAIAALHETVASDLDAAAIDPTDAILETVGTLPTGALSEQELRRTIRDVRHDLTTAIDASQSAAEQRKRFTETLQQQATACRAACEELQPHRPFRKVDVLGPETQRHSRWHARAMAHRDVSGHGELVRQLYQERLAALAEDEGWE